MNIVRLESWRTPASEYPRSRIKTAAIKTAWYKSGFYECYAQQGFNYFEAKKKLYITTLTIDGKIWMVDDPPHWWAMKQHADELRGHVLCAGLGLGLMVHTLTENSEIERITVVERSQDVIDLIGPLVPHDKLQIIRGDFYQADSNSIPDVDGVLFDLFVGKGQDFFSTSIAVASEIMERWDHPDIRIHGMPNPLIENIATAIRMG